MYTLTSLFTEKSVTPIRINNGCGSITDEHEIVQDRRNRCVLFDFDRPVHGGDVLARITGSASTMRSIRVRRSYGIGKGTTAAYFNRFS